MLSGAAREGPAAEAGELGGAGRFQSEREEVPLAEQAAHAAHGVQLLRGFNALGDDLHAEGVAEADHGLKHRGLAVISSGAGDELGRDFDDVDGQAGEVIERREAGAEVIDSDSDLALGHAIEDACGGIRIAIQGSLSDLKEQAGGVDGVGGEGLLELADHFRMIELAFRQVESEVKIGCVVRPVEQLAANGVHGFTAERDGEAGIFGDAEQLKEAVDGAVWAAEAEERFKALKLAADEVIDGLVPDFVLMPFKHAAEFPLGVLGGLAVGQCEVPVKDFADAAAVHAGAVQGEIRIADEDCGGRVLWTGDGQAHADADANEGAEDLEGLLHVLEDAGGDGLKIVEVEDVFNQDGELVAGEAGGGIFRSQACLEAVGDGGEQGVSGGGAEGVVDLVEAVEIDEQDAAVLVATAGAALEREGEPVEKERAVGQAGEQVKEGVQLDFFFGLLSVGDVTKAEHIADFCGIYAERADDEGDVDEVAVFVDADGFSVDAASDVDFFFEHCEFVVAGLGDDQLTEASATDFFSGIAEHLGESGVGVEDVAAVDDDHGLRNAGQNVFHEARLGRLDAAAGVGNDDGFPEFGIEDAVGAFNGEQAAAAGGHGGVEGASGAGTDELGLRLRGAGEQSPEDVFNGAVDPVHIHEAEGLAGFHIGVDDSAGALKEDEDGQSIENFLLLCGVCVLR